MIVDLETIDREKAVQAIVAMESELFGRGAWSENMVREELDAPARTYVFDRDGNGIIRGYAGYWYDGEDAELMTIGVGAAWQRQGIAAALLNRLVESAREQGAQRMLLEVRVDNEPALHLYRKFGFVRLGLRKRYYQPEGIDAYTMALDLEPHVVGFQRTNQLTDDHTVVSAMHAGSEYDTSNDMNAQSDEQGDAQ
ncbi:ribosomal protein S18-alanine N-acetyltransferase [Bifidobacterium oedipodis]|uniref:Ribosomal-protein-alanine N-acetyltransferase RimI n=1 Tax=Bifidobacterium oedipodis TaxID=2675322 RepID=A0A7Y0EQ19_9BIFI|nr:ribosomal protein S18-alanine N-acetyltransferase [Bifidobacterium sp. DSM 109957]NMM94325.1 ribosomal-protein-alanine N-acetyltransferase RimI [Bifidobacterium sp. DSM 109957]